MAGRLILVGLLLVLGLTQGQAQARGPWRSTEDNTRGWHYMSPEERIEHQARIRSFNSYEACQAYREQHHRLMEARARREGKALAGGGRDFCAHLKGGSPPP